MRRTRAATILLASLLTAACTAPRRGGADEGGGNPDLSGTRWSLEALAGDAVPGTPAVTLHFGSDGRISGSDGCNPYHGQYSADGDSIRVADDLVGTMMACPDPVEAQANAYREALQQATRFAVDDRQLSLHDGTGRLLARFVPEVRSPVGIAWEVIAFNNGKQGVVSVIAGTHITAGFGDDGRVTGNAGCNAYFASYELDGPSLSIGLPGATRRFCADPEGLMQQEALYLEALRSASSLLLNGDRLELRTSDGALAVSLGRIAGE